MRSQDELADRYERTVYQVVRNAPSFGVIREQVNQALRDLGIPENVVGRRINLVIPGGETEEDLGLAPFSEEQIHRIEFFGWEFRTGTVRGISFNGGSKNPSFRRIRLITDIEDNIILMPSLRTEDGGYFWHQDWWPYQGVFELPPM